jgi:hypothetical protein
MLYPGSISDGHPPAVVRTADAIVPERRKHHLHRKTSVLLFELGKCFAFSDFSGRTDNVFLTKMDVSRLYALQLRPSELLPQAED